MALLRIFCWALIFILRLRFPSGSSIASILLTILNSIVGPELGVTILFNIVHSVTVNNVGSKTLFNPGFINILAMYANKDHSRLKIYTVKKYPTSKPGPGRNKQSCTTSSVKKTLDKENGPIFPRCLEKSFQVGALIPVIWETI